MQKVSYIFIKFLKILYLERFYKFRNCFASCKKYTSIIGTNIDQYNLLIVFVILQVRDRDTLTSVAARFDTTPSELTKLNRLATQFIFSGQNLLVPDKRKGGHSIISYPNTAQTNISFITVKN